MKRLVLLFVLAATAEAQWAGKWPGDGHSQRESCQNMTVGSYYFGKEVVSNVIAKDSVLIDSLNALEERYYHAKGYTYSFFETNQAKVVNDLRYRNQRDALVMVKELIVELVFMGWHDPFIPESEFGSWFGANAKDGETNVCGFVVDLYDGDARPLLTLSNIIVYCLLPTNYFDHTPDRDLWHDECGWTPVKSIIKLFESRWDAYTFFDVVSCPDDVEEVYRTESSSRAGSLWGNWETKIVSDPFTSFPWEESCACLTTNDPPENLCPPGSDTEPYSSGGTTSKEFFVTCNDDMQAGWPRYAVETRESYGGSTYSEMESGNYFDGQYVYCNGDFSNLVAIGIEYESGDSGNISYNNIRHETDGSTEMAFCGLSTNRPRHNFEISVFRRYVRPFSNVTTTITFTRDYFSEAYVATTNLACSIAEYSMLFGLVATRQQPPYDSCEYFRVLSLDGGDETAEVQAGETTGSRYSLVGPGPALNVWQNYSSSSSSTTKNKRYSPGDYQWATLVTYDMKYK